MKTKSLKQYKKEFELIEKPTPTEKWNMDILDSYQHLAEECIRDYPDEELGYKHLGLSVAGFVGEKNFEDRVEKISALTKNDFRYIPTLEAILENSGISAILPELIFRTVQAPFAKIHELCGNMNGMCADYAIAAEDYEIAIKLGIDYNKFIKKLNPPINEIIIKDFLCLNDIKIESISKYKETYFVGENGVGKTLLLQAIIIGLIEHDHFKREFYHSLHFPKDEISRQYNHKIDIEIQNLYTGGSDPDSLYQNIFGYGVSRFREGDTKVAEYGFETLFDKGTLLTNPLQWLDLVRVKEKAKESDLSIHTVLAFLNQLINFEENTDFKIELKDTKFFFYEQGTPTDFDHLADGYRSVIVWVCDLLSRLTKNQPYIKHLKDFYGIVLVDEIDMFLHPKWEYRIVDKLREKFENIQWFFSTHSPMLIMGASDDAIFYKVYKKDGKTDISKKYTFKQIGDLLANGIITSPLFDMEYPGMREQADKESPNMDTNDTYLHSRINKYILKKSREVKKTKAYISPETIDQWINEAMQLNEGGSYEKRK